MILVLGTLTAFGPLSIDMYLPAFPEISRNLGVPMSSVELSLSSYFVGLALGQLFYGPLTDRFGRKLPLYLGMGIYCVTSVFCALVPSVEALIGVRFLQALGACAGIVIPRAVVRDVFSHQEAARVFSALMLVMGVAPILAPILGGYLTSAFGWRSVFWALAAWSALCLAGISLLLPETGTRKRGSMRLGQVFSNYRVLFRDRGFLGYTLAGGAAQAGLFSYIAGSPFVFIEYFGVSPEHYSWIFGCNALGLITVSQINRAILRTRAIDAVLRASLTVLALAGAALIIAGVAGAGFWGIVVPLFFFLGSLGMVFPNTAAAALARQSERAGSASALMGTLQFTLSATSSGIVSSLHTGTALPMTAVVGVCGILALAIWRGVARTSGLGSPGTEGAAA